MELFIKESEKRIQDILALFQKELGGFRTNRPAPQLIEDIKVAYGGQMLPLKHVGSISVAPPRDLILTLWDVSAVAPAAKAIEDAKIGATSSVQGMSVRVALPPMSDERRQEMVRLIKSIAEKFRIQVRALRDEANKKIEAALKAKEIGEDQKFKLRERVQKAVDAVNKAIEDAVTKKSAEIQE